MEETHCHFLNEKKTKILALLDLRRINQYVQYQPFKMEGLPTIQDMIQPRDYLIIVDLSNAYLTQPIHPKSRPYPSFKYQGETCSYEAMLFGLASAPRIFSKPITSSESNNQTTSDPRSTTPEIPKGAPTTVSTSDRMEIVRHALKAKGVPEKASELTSKAERATTGKHYTSA
ncbi:uncharacterized protein VTP21DRAFT_4059 [Calcarisporiella thermophila]|uniref:uncharacterized protein n=1 Tax=Calcarisporiella thermophila TaxID=911321 RepID=UPI00374281BA